MRLVRSPNELIFESSSRKEISLQNYQLATGICCVQSKRCVLCKRKRNQNRRCLNLALRLCTARRCLRCWQVRQALCDCQCSCSRYSHQSRHCISTRVLLYFIFLAAIRHFHCIFEHTEIQNIGLHIDMLAIVRHTFPVKIS